MMYNLNPGPQSVMHDLQICHANICSLKAKTKLLFIKTGLTGKHNIIALSKTWLCDTDKSSDFKMAGYQLPFL